MRATADRLRPCAALLLVVGLQRTAVAAESWQATGSLATARTGHQALLVPDGRVLAVGGGALATTETLDLNRGTWSRSEPMGTARSGHRLVLLRNGRALAIGPGTTTELRDPATGAWTASGVLGTARTDFTATLLADGRVLVVGGHAGPAPAYATAEVYNPTTGTWASTGSMVTPRYSHFAVLLANGKVLVGGGLGSASGAAPFAPLATAEVWDPAAGGGVGAFTATGSLTAARQRATATLLPDGRVLVAGGDQDPTALASSEVWDPAAGGGAGAFSASGPLAAARSLHTATLLPNGKVLATGGCNGASCGTYLASAEIWDPAGAGSWSAALTMPTARRRHVAAIVPDGRIVVVGGENSGGALATTAIWEAGTDAWSATGSMATARDEPLLVPLADGRALAVGGIGGTTTAEVWNPFPAPGAWSFAGTMVAARERHTLTLLQDGRVLAVGGAADLVSAETWDPATGLWTATGNMTVGRERHTATLLGDGRVLATGGASTAARTSSEVWSPTPPPGAWTPSGTLNAIRTFHTATLLADGRVLVLGGPLGANTAEIWDPKTGLWTATGTLVQGRTSSWSTRLLDGRVLAVGGCAGLTCPTTLASAETWDPATGTWTATGSLATARKFHMGAWLLPDGRVLVAGGCAAGGCTQNNSTEIWDPATGLWKAGGALGAVRADHGIAYLPASNRLLIAGGNGPVATAEVWDPDPSTPDPDCEPYFGQLGAGLPSDPWPSGSTVPAKGGRLTGCSEGSGGGATAGPSNFPLVRLVSLSNQQQAVWGGAFTRPRDWTSSDVSFTVPGDAGLAPGYYGLSVSVNGVASRSRIVRLSQTHQKLYAHREGPGGSVRWLCPESPSVTTACGSAHTVAVKDVRLCRSLGTAGSSFLIETVCASATNTGQHAYPAGGFAADTGISGPWTLRADVRKSGTGTTGLAWLFARIKRHSDGCLIHETERVTAVNIGAIGNTDRELITTFVIPPRAVDAAPCNATTPSASTKIPAGDRVRVEWYVDVQTPIAEDLQLALEAPGSTAGSLAELSSETLAATPLAARIGGLEASRTPDGVEISWELFEPWEVLRMQVSRADSEGGPFGSFGEAIEPAGALLETGSYARLDPDPPRKPWYRLEVTLADGTVEIHGPVSPDLDEESAPGCGCRAPDSQVSPRGALAMAAAALAVLLVLRRRAAL